MKFWLQRLVMVSCFFLMAGCGSGGGDYVGDLTISPSQSDNKNGTSAVTFVVQYKNSQASDYSGLPYSYSYSISGGSSVSKDSQFSSSGIDNITFAAVPTGSTVYIQVKVGDIVSSASVTVAPASLTVADSSLVFSATGLKSTTISGGTAPYSAQITATATGGSAADFNVKVVGASLQVTLLNANTSGTAKSVTITVSDSLANTKAVTVTY